MNNIRFPKLFSWKATTIATTTLATATTPTTSTTKNENIVESVGCISVYFTILVMPFYVLCLL